MDPIRIDVVSDVVCPWCYIGKRQLEKALERWAQRDPAAPTPEVVWHAFQLSPEIPTEGIARDEYLRRKFGTADTRRLYTRVATAAEAAGLAMNFERIARQPNTLAAHALIAALPAGPPQQALVEALFRAYFVDGADLTSRDTLLDLAEGAGLPRASAEGLVDDRETLDAIERSESELREMGVSGVPLFVIDRRIGVQGAQGADAILEALEKAQGEREEG